MTHRPAPSLPSVAIVVGLAFACLAVLVSYWLLMKLRDDHELTGAGGCVFIAVYPGETIDVGDTRVVVPADTRRMRACLVPPGGAGFP